MSGLWRDGTTIATGGAVLPLRSTRRCSGDAQAALLEADVTRASRMAGLSTSMSSSNPGSHSVAVVASLTQMVTWIMDAVPASDHRGRSRGPFMLIALGAWLLAACGGAGAPAPGGPLPAA